MYITADRGAHTNVNRVWNYAMEAYAPVMGEWLSGGATAAIFGASMLLTVEAVQRIILHNIYLLW